MAGTTIILVIVAIIIIYIYVNSDHPHIIPYNANANATPKQEELATIIVNKMMSARPDSFDISIGGIYKYGDLVFSFESIGYAGLPNKYAVMKLANLVVKIAKQKYPNNDWSIIAEYSNGNAYGNTFREFRHVRVKLLEMPQKLKKVF